MRCGRYLCGNNQVIPLPRVLLDSLAHNTLRLAVGIHLGAVEKVDAAVVGGLHACKGALAVDVAAVREPAAQRDGRDLEAGSAEEAVFHLGETFWF